MQVLELSGVAAESARWLESYVRITQPHGSRWLVSARTADHLRRSWLGWSLSAAPHRAPEFEAQWREARARLVFGWSARICAPLPPSVADEATLWLYTRPRARLEFMGRGRFVDRQPGTGSMIYLDHAGGRRSYAFRVLDGAEAVDERARLVAETYRGAGAWLDDPEARIVLAMGGGGYRLFAAQAAVRGIEALLDGDRSRIHEVWGTSGGALLGYAFAHGHDLWVIEQLGYLLYRGRTPDLPGLDVRTAAYMVRRLLARRSIEGVLRPELSEWVDTIDRLCPASTRSAMRIPYYAVASNTRWRHPIALADAAHVPRDCEDILVPCPSDVAAGASMAVPLLLNPSRGRIPGYERDLWFDGGVVEENPLMLPFIKWMRDRRRDPVGTPRRLKVVLVNLNMRLSESRLLRVLGPRRSLEWASTAAALVDLLLDSKTNAIVRTLREVGDVEIMTATLDLGRLSFIARTEIPQIIRTGQILESWRIELPGVERIGVR